MTEQEIDDLETELGKAFSQRRRQELMAGNPGESHWHTLPAHLKQELETHMAAYQAPKYGKTLATFDGPCIWLDMETRLCKNHTVRPNVCRDFETGNPDCLQWRDTYADRILPDRGS